MNANSKFNLRAGLKMWRQASLPAVEGGILPPGKKLRRAKRSEFNGVSFVVTPIRRAGSHGSTSAKMADATFFRPALSSPNRPISPRRILCCICNTKSVGWFNAGAAERRAPESQRDSVSKPRVARPSQPWAERCYPVGVISIPAAPSPFASIRVHSRLTISL